MSDDLIRRSDAIEAIEEVDWYHQNKNKDMVSGANSAEHQAWYKAEDIYKALEAVPTADRKTENSSEKPNNCETCRFELYCPEMCEGCCEWDSHYEPKDDPQERNEHDDIL